jgi:chemotaxis signal transduction protein
MFFKRRMESIADVQAPEGVASVAAPQWVVFACGGHEFAVPLVRAREILPPRDFTRLPGCGPEVCGLLGLRGHAVTVFDFGSTVGLRAATAFPDYRLLLLEHQDRLTGFAVERIVAVAHATQEQGAECKVRLNDDEVLGHGTLEDDGRRFLIIDPDALLRRLLA